MPRTTTSSIGHGRHRDARSHPAFSVQTPQWANYEPLSVKYTKRVGGLDFGLGRNNAHCRASFHLATHMDGEKHFWAGGRTIGEVPLDYWHGPGVIVDISEAVSDSSVYTPQMIEDRVDLQDGDILLIRTGYGQYGWNSPDSDEFRYMIKHPGPSPGVLGLVRRAPDQVAGDRLRGDGASDEHHPAGVPSQDLR